MSSHTRIAQNKSTLPAFLVKSPVMKRIQTSVEWKHVGRYYDEPRTRLHPVDENDEQAEGEVIA